MNIFMRQLILAFLVILATTEVVRAQDWSFVYIQGDKKTPFYVKLEGQMLPRYGKNYHIIPRLESGPIKVQILFQQNAYPPQDYTILVPDFGYRGFLLVQKEGAYALYDIQQQFYLKPGEEDRLPPEDAVGSEPETATVISEPVTEPDFESATEPVSDISADETGITVEPQETKAVVASNSSEPAFIANLVLNKTGNSEDSAVAEKALDVTEDVLLESGKPGIPNSDCPEPMTDKTFRSVLNYLPDMKQNDKLIVYFLKQSSVSCFSTRQVYQLALRLKSESVRFTFLKNVYSRVTDQQNFSMLETHLFQSKEWRAYFQSIQ